jgi:hypothetical protein
MINQRMIVAWMFRIGALLIGIPALIGLFQILMFLFVGVEVVNHAPEYPWIDIQKYGIAGLIWNSGEFFKVMFQMLAGLGVIVAAFLAFALTVMIGVAILFFFTGIGVARRADWAKVMGIALSAMCVLFWIGGLRSEHVADIALSAMAEALAIYAIWVLGWRYT